VPMGSAASFDTRWPLCWTRRLPRLAAVASGAIAAACVLGPVVRQAAAHSFAPALLEVRERPDGSALVVWKTSPLRPSGTSLDPILPERCAPASPRSLDQSGEGVVETWVVDCGRGGLVGETISVRDLAASRSDALVRIALADGRVVQAVLRPDEPELVVPARPSRLDVFRSYAGLGVEHIATGPDHLLFVLGLLLIVRGRRSLLQTITAFTIGHSLTLTLAVLGIANVSSAATELLIALSVLALAVEIARGPSEPKTLVRTRPWLVAFAFGLLHGLGFAGALREIGLPEGEIPIALFSFNVGIEVGQIAFVAVVEVAWLVLRRLAERASRRSRASALARLQWVPSYAMGTLAAYWCWERAGALLHLR